MRALVVIPATLLLLTVLWAATAPPAGAYVDPFPYRYDRADRGLVTYPPSRPYPYGGYYNPHYRPYRYPYRYRYAPPPSPYYSPYPYPYPYPSPYPYAYPRRYPYYPYYGPYYRR